MEISQIIEHLENAPSSQVRIAVTDIDGLHRGKVMNKQKVIKSLKDGFGFCDVIFGWDSKDALYDQDSITGWQSGFPDAQATLDHTTFRILPWHKNIPMLLADFQNSLPEICPRSILKKQQEKASSLGFETNFSMEFEWFNFQKDGPLKPISQDMFGYSLLRMSQHQDYWAQLFDQLEMAGIAIEGLHTETGPGVMEAAIMKDEIVRAADQAVLFKSAVKEIASQHQIMASFMAKWNSNLPGCSGHMHQSLLHRGHNLFQEKDGKMSEIMEQYLAGILYTLPDFLPIYAPTINSYKRLVEGSWAPTSVSWGKENRTVACRVIQSNADQSRIELRVTGADNNPYLSMAAALGSGLYGIENNLKLDMPEISGNAYHENSSNALPTSLKDAIQIMKNSTVSREILGSKFIDHFIMTREWEISQFESNVSNWEIERYMEGI